jgi:phosphate-selective porin
MHTAFKFLLMGTVLVTSQVKAQEDPLQLNDTAIISEAATPVTAPATMKKKWNHYTGKFMTVNLGMAVILDFNTQHQDNNSIQQVGSYASGTEFRADRFMLYGMLGVGSKHPWRYMFSANYNGLDAPPDKKFDFIDWNLEIPVGSKGGWITVGKQKEGVGMEYIMPGTQGMFTERGSGSPMLVRQRNVGIRYSRNFFNQMASFTVGVFNNYWETGKSFRDNGTQAVFRFSGLPRYKSDRDLLHLGIAYRYSDPTDGKLTYKAKPEMNTAPLYINSGAFAASGANTLFLEAVHVSGPVALVGEYMNAKIRSTEKNNPTLTYFQLGGSWFITGENRKYNKMTGNLGKLIPKKPFKFAKNSGPGAWELGARFTQTNGNDALLTAGNFNRFTTALSWFPNPSFRFEINYGAGKLWKSNLTGTTDFWQFRIQFEL